MSVSAQAKRRPRMPSVTTQIRTEEVIPMLSHVDGIPLDKPPTPPISADDAPYLNGGLHFPTNMFSAHNGNGIAPHKMNGYHYSSNNSYYKDKDIRIGDRFHPLKKTASSLLGRLRSYHLGSEKDHLPLSEKTLSSPTNQLESTSSYSSYIQLPSLLSHFISSDLLKFCTLCFLWYSSSAVTNNIGKQILNQFRFPVTLTFVQFGFVAAYCFAWGRLFGMTQIRPVTREIIKSTLPLSIFQIVGHVFSSVAISRVPVSFVHTIKALSPLFTVIFYRFFFNITYTSRVYTSLFPLTLGVMLACSFQMSSNAVGLLCALGSCIIFVTQNIFSKKLLFKESKTGERRAAKLDKINLLFYSSAMAFLLMAPLWFFTEGITLLSDIPVATPPSHVGEVAVSGYTITFYIFLNGASHFLQNILAFNILALTSPVTYSIASLVKRIFVIVASIIWFGQAVSFLQWIGIILTFVGLWMYQEAKKDVERGEERLRVGGSNNILPMSTKGIAIGGFNSKV